MTRKFPALALMLVPLGAQTGPGAKQSGLDLMRQGRTREAVAAFQQALKAAPRDPELLNNLGVALRIQGDLAGSLKALQSALQLRPQDAQVQSNLALTLRAMGRLHLAVAAMRTAVALRPDDPALHRNFDEGAGNIEGENDPSPFLSTIDWPRVELGRIAANLLVAAIANPDQDPREEILSPRILRRQSTAQPAAWEGGR